MKSDSWFTRTVYGGVSTLEHKLVALLQPLSALALNQKLINNLYPMKLHFALVERALGSIKTRN